MNKIRIIAVGFVAALACSLALAQQHDPVGGGSTVNITAGNIDGRAGGGLNIYPNSTLGMVGTVTNDSANAGSIGEVLRATVASGSAVTLTTTATSYNVTSVALTPGDWDCRAQVEYVPSSATTTVFQTGISLTSATLPTQPGGSGIGYEPLLTSYIPMTTASNLVSQAIPPMRVSIAASSTLYVVANLTFSAGSATAYGSVSCRRIR